MGVRVPSGQQLIIFLVVLSTCWTAPAHALSCAGGTDRYFVQCSTNGCAVAFSVRETPARALDCARRAVVDSPSSDAAAVILDRARSELISPGVYEVTLVHKNFLDQAVSAAELARALDAGALGGPEMSVYRVADDGSTVQDLRFHWESRSRRSLLEYFWLIDLLLFALALAAVLWSAALFRKRVALGEAGRVAPVLGVQAGLFLLGLLSLASSTWLVLIGLIAPVLLMVWAYELAAFLFARDRRRIAREL